MDVEVAGGCDRSCGTFVVSTQRGEESSQRKAPRFGEAAHARIIQALEGLVALVPAPGEKQGRGLVQHVPGQPSR